MLAECSVLISNFHFFILEILLKSFRLSCRREWVFYSHKASLWSLWTGLPSFSKVPCLKIITLKNVSFELSPKSWGIVTHFFSFSPFSFRLLSTGISKRGDSTLLLATPRNHNLIYLEIILMCSWCVFTNFKNVSHS